MSQWREIGEVQDNNPDSVSAWKDILYRYSDNAISAIGAGQMKTGDALSDDRRQRAALEIEFNRKVDSGEIEDEIFGACPKCGCAYHECEC